MNTQRLIKEVASLPIEDRALMVDSLLQSLNPTESDIDKKWAAAAKRRLADLRSGAVQAIPGQQVFDRIWARFEK